MINSTKNRSYWYVHFIGITLILIILYLITLLTLMIITRHNREYTVPDFTQQSIASALILAEDYELRLDVTDSVYVKRLGRGLITKQNPKPGSKVKKNRRILLTINALNAKEASVPSLIGYSLRQAKTELISQGLSVGRLIYQEDMATNNVLSQMYNGKEIPPATIVNSGTEIDLVLGMNNSNNTTYIPSTFGYKLISAKDIITDNSLNMGKLFYDETVISYADTLNAVIYKLLPEPSDSISYRMGIDVHLYLTTNETKVPIIEEEIKIVEPKVEIVKTEVVKDTTAKIIDQTFKQIIEEIERQAKEKREAREAQRQ